MSQFQQPQDNRYVRPGVLDLGTGRQFDRLSVSKTGEGSLGSGARGGGFVQGRSRTGTGLSGVDPLAQILGAASDGIEAFLEADQTILKARDAEAERNLDELERIAAQRRIDAEGAKDPNDAMTEAEMAALDRQDLQDFVKNYGAPPSRGNAINRHSRLLDAAVRADRAYTYADRFRTFKKEMTEVGNDWDAEDILIREFLEASAPHEKDQAKRDMEQYSLSANTRRVNHEINEDVQETMEKFNTRLRDQGFLQPTTNEDGTQGPDVINPDRVLELANFVNPPIDINDPEAGMRMTEVFLALAKEDIKDLPAAAQQRMLKGWASMFQTQSEGFVRSARFRLRGIQMRQRVEDTASDFDRFLRTGVKSRSTTPAIRTGIAGVIDVAQQAVQDEERRKDAVVNYSARWRSLMNQDPVKWQRQGAEAVSTAAASQLIADSVSAARNAPTDGSGPNGLEILNGARDAIPFTAEEAQKAGWFGAIPPGESDDYVAMSDEEWAIKRDEVILAVRTAQLKASAPAFDARLSAAASVTDVQGIMGVAEDLADLTGIAHPLELFNDPNSVGHPSGVSVFGTEYNQIFAKIAGQLRRSLGANQQKPGAAEWLVSAANNGYGPTAKAMGRPQEWSSYAHEEPMNGPTEVTDITGVKQLRATIETSYVNANGQISESAADIHNAVVLLEQRLTDDPNQFSEARVRGLVQGANLLMWAETIGTQAADDGLQFMAPQGTISQVRSAFEDHDGGPLQDPADAEYIANLYFTLQDKPDHLEDLFGPDLLAARLTAEQYEGTGGWNSDTLQVENDRGESIFAAPVVADREAMADGWSAISSVSKHDAYELTGLALDAMLLPMDDPGQAALTALTTDGKAMGILQAVGEDREDFLNKLASDLGINAKDNPNWLRSFGVEFEEIAAEASLDVSQRVGTKPELITSDKQFGQTFRDALVRSISRRFKGKAYVGGRPMNDPTGVIRQAVKATDSNDPEVIWSRYRDADIATITSQAGITDDSPEVMVQTFYKMFPDFADDNVDPAELMARAQKISDGSEQAGFGITVGHLVKASAELSPEGKNFRAADDTTMWADAQVRSDGGSMLWTFPNQSGGNEIIRNLRFNPMMSLDTGRPVLGSPVRPTAAGRQNRVFLDAFDRTDTDGDGVLSQSEIDAYNANLPMTTPGALDRAIGVKPKRTSGIKWKVGEARGERNRKSTTRKDD